MSSIYAIKNIVNDKIYIGQTIQDVAKRFKKHKSQINCKNVCSALYEAFKKYGVDNFYVETIISGEFTREQLDELEQFFIYDLNCISPNGYNILSGGKSPIMHVDTKSRIAATLKGRNITWGKAISKTMSEKWKDETYRAAMVKKHTGKRGYEYAVHTKPLKLNIDPIKITELQAEGYTINKIAKTLNVAFDTIKRRI